MIVLFYDPGPTGWGGFDFEAFKAAKMVHGKMLEPPRTFGSLAEGEYFRQPDVNGVFVKRRGDLPVGFHKPPTAVWISGGPCDDGSRRSAGVTCWIEDERHVIPVDLVFEDA